MLTELKGVSILKKLLSILISLILCLNLCAVASAAEDWTVFVYICGSNLESESACASDNMQQMIDSGAGSNMRFVVETGGASYWYNDADPDELDRFLIANGACKLVDRQPLASMGETETLADFLRWGLAEYPAEHVGLILWDHGSGSINGVCFDELDDDESLYLKDIEKALDSVRGLLPNGFDFIGFDACLMSTLETAAVLAPYAKYMVASQELIPGIGWDYDVMGLYLEQVPSADGAEAGKVICDSYFENCASYELEDNITLSVIDLDKIGALRVAFDAFAKDLYSAVEADVNYAPVARAIAAAENFGSNNRSEGYTNMVDLGGLIAAGEAMSSHAAEARAALDNAISYQVRGPVHDHASGLSVYYPLEVQGSMELSIFKDVCVSAYYLGLVDMVAYGFSNGGDWDNYDSSTEWTWDDAAQEDGQSTAVSFAEEPFVDEYGIYSFVLSDDALNYTESVEAMVYLITDDVEDCICIGYTTDVITDWESGTVQDNFDGYWFSLPDGQCLCVYHVDDYDSYSVFTSPVEVNGREKNLRFAWDYNSGVIQVLGIWDGIGTNGIASRPGESLNPGDVIVPLYDAFSMTTDEEFQYYGEAYMWDKGDSLCFNVLPDGEYLYAFCINDIFGGNYLTDFVNFSMYEGGVSYEAA